MVASSLVIRFLLEIVAIASLAYSGYKLPSATTTKVLVAVSAPLALIVVWAFVVAPGAVNPLSQTARMLIGSLLLLLSATALAAVGKAKLGIIVAAVIVLNTIMRLAFPGH